MPWNDFRSAAAGALVAEVISFLRNRFKKEPKRPKVVAIFAPNGDVLRKIALKRPDEEPKDDV